ncbi:MAG: carbohydrate ABC transporter permease [Candidatus Bipolaricaulia bacterium]
MPPDGTAGQAYKRPALKRAQIGRTLTLYAILIVYGSFVLAPILLILMASFQPSGVPSFVPEALTLKNYEKIVKDPRMRRGLLNSLIVAGGSTVLSVLTSALAGYAFSRFRFPGKNALMGIMLGIFMIPVLINIIPLFTMFQRIGWLDTYHGLIIPYQALILPLNVWLLKNFFDTIPVDLEEAAMIDGASRMRAFWKVTFPLTWPGVAVASIFAFRFSWNEFVFAATFTFQSEMKTFQAALYNFLGLGRTDWGALTAGVIVGMIPVVILFLIFQRRFIEGLTLGALK